MTATEDLPDTSRCSVAAGYVVAMVHADYVAGVDLRDRTRSKYEALVPAEQGQVHQALNEGAQAYLQNAYTVAGWPRVPSSRGVPGGGHWTEELVFRIERDGATNAHIADYDRLALDEKGRVLTRLRPGRRKELQAILRIRAGSTEAPPKPKVEVTDTPSTWQPVPLADIVGGDLTPPQPTVLRIEDARHLLYPGAINGIHGDSGIGKSWILDYAIVQELLDGRHACLIDLEDNERSVASRVLAFGVQPDAIVERLVYVRPQEPATETDIDDLIVELKRRNVGLVGIDSVGEALAVEGRNEDRDNEVGPWLRQIPRRLADAGPAVLLVDHSTKDANNPLHASGSKRKRAAMTGASYLVEETGRPLMKSDGHDPVEGRLKITCAKDRHGSYGRGQVIADFALTSYPDGGVTAHLWPVTNEDRNVDVRGILAAKDAVRAAKEAGKPVSQSVLLGLMKIKASREIKKSGIDIAVMKGALGETSGPKGARLFEFVAEMVDGL